MVYTRNRKGLIVLTYCIDKEDCDGDGRLKPLTKVPLTPQIGYYYGNESQLSVV